MLVAVRFLVAPTLTNGSVDDIHTIGWTVEPSSASEGGNWPVVGPHRMVGATVLTQYAGVILLYHPNAYTVPQGGLSQTAINHSDWSVRVNANPAVYGPGVGMDTSFRPQWYFDGARQAHQDFIRMIDAAALDAGAELVAGGRVNAACLLYTSDAADE